MELNLFKGFPLDLKKQISAATYELGMIKFGSDSKWRHDAETMLINNERQKATTNSPDCIGLMTWKPSIFN